MPEWSSYIVEDGVQKPNPVFGEINQAKLSELPVLSEYGNHPHYWIPDHTEDTDTWEGATCKVCHLGRRGPKGTLPWGIEQVQSSVSQAE